MQSITRLYPVYDDDGWNDQQDREDAKRNDEQLDVMANDMLADILGIDRNSIWVVDSLPDIDEDCVCEGNGYFEDDEEYCDECELGEFLHDIVDEIDKITGDEHDK